MQEINIHPTNLGFQVEKRLPAKVDTGVKYHIVSKKYVSYIGNPKMGSVTEKKITDSRGESYDSVGTITATWSVQGYHNSQLTDFIVVEGNFPKGVDVLLANSEKVRSSLSSSSKSSIPLMLPLFYSTKTKS